MSDNIINIDADQIVFAFGGLLISSKRDGILDQSHPQICVHVSKKALQRIVLYCKEVDMVSQYEFKKATKQADE